MHLADCRIRFSQLLIGLQDHLDREMSSTATFSVEMKCSGCSGACTRILNKIPGVNDVQATLDDQKIIVKYDPAQANPDDMLAALKKWGDAGNKKVELL